MTSIRDHSIHSNSPSPSPPYPPPFSKKFLDPPSSGSPTSISGSAALSTRDFSAFVSLWFRSNCSESPPLTSPPPLKKFPTPKLPRASSPPVPGRTCSSAISRLGFALCSFLTLVLLCFRPGRSRSSRCWRTSSKLVGSVARSYHRRPV